MKTLKENQVEKIQNFLKNNFDPTPHQNHIGSNSSVKYHEELIVNGDCHKNCFAIWAGGMSPIRIEHKYTDMINYLKKVIEQDHI
ncbi:hypothetical protein [Chondrinema litorale]|uniref:hypothetical protein n=1 Tax=Chondrinema litorale TaxID=2994555 RepID=UPI002542C181|nr:hypothetical protein [Chondrinema litorale]UZS00293.1 hypothetical protein OQ292_40845 [Chondrinema litorale]